MKHKWCHWQQEKSAKKFHKKGDRASTFYPGPNIPFATELVNEDENEDEDEKNNVIQRILKKMCNDDTKVKISKSYVVDDIF